MTLIDWEASSRERAMATRIVVVEGHPMFSEALVHTIHGGIPGVATVVATSLPHAVRLSSRQGPFALGLLDMRMPDDTNVEALARLVAAFPLVPFGVLSTVPNSRFVDECLDRGALGVITKSADGNIIINAVRSMLAGETTRPADYMPSFEASEAIETLDLATHLRSLSPQQTRVLLLVCQGLSNRDIGVRTGLREATIKSHVTGILKRLRVKSRTEAVAKLLHCDPEFWKPEASNELSVFRDVGLRRGFDASDAIEPRLQAPMPERLRTAVDC